MKLEEKAAKYQEGRQVTYENEGADDIYDASNPCQETGIQLEKGKKYLVEVLQPQGWEDGGVAARFDGLESFWSRFKPEYFLGAALRRRIRFPWFVLTGEIGRDTGIVFPINRRVLVDQSPAMVVLGLDLVFVRAPISVCRLENVIVDVAFHGD